MITDKYRIAGVVVQITSQYSSVHRQCRAYLCREDVPAQITVHIRPADIAAERTAHDQEEGSPTDAYLETLAVYRRLAEAMLETQDTLLIHGSALAVDGRAVLFAAKSGTGKSTHAALWRQLLGERCVIVNDDKPLVRIRPDTAQVCGTPWNGKHNLDTNCIVPLQAICMLERGEQNQVMPITFREALPELLQQSYQPQDRRQMSHVLQLLEMLSGRVRFYRIRCNMEEEAARLAYEAILGTNMM